MSTDADRIRRALKQDPDEYFREHRDLAERIREETDDDVLAETIDAVLANLDTQEGSG